MDIEKHLILLKGEDQTEKISRCVYEDGKYQVTFLPGKTYTYNHANVQWFKDPVALDPAATAVYKDKLEFESENLMNAVIEKVLGQDEFQNLDWVLHQPLKMLIRNPERLDDDECKFAMNILTHTDFVIFNKLDKMPVLVVEVDGYAYHVNNPKQVARDRMKDAILEKYGIPILRLRTNESSEEARLNRKLKEILNLV